MEPLIPTVEDIKYFSEIMKFLKEELSFKDNFRKDDFESWYRENKKYFPKKYRMTNGLTKAVFISNEDCAPAKRFVMKMPFDFFKEDRCKIEADVYKAFSETAYTDCFAACYEIGDGMYLMERTEVMSPHALITYGSSKENKLLVDYSLTGIDLEVIQDELEQGCTIDDDDLEYMAIEQVFLDYLGKEEYMDFCTFCYDNGVSDFHAGNVGFINDRPVVIDYSGV